MRLRAYSYYNQTPTEIFDDAEQTLQQLRIISTTTLLVETREPHEVWATFDPMALYIRVSRLNEEGGFDEPHVIACQASDTLEGLLQSICEEFRIGAATKISVVKTRPVQETLYTTGKTRYLTGEVRKYHRLTNGYQLYLAVLHDEQVLAKLNQALENAKHQISIRFTSPNSSKVFTVQLDKRDEVLVLRRTIASTLALDPGQFKIKEKYRELREDSHILGDRNGGNLRDMSTVTIEAGIPGSAMIVFKLCDKEDITVFSSLCELQVVQTADVNEVKAMVGAELEKQGKVPASLDVAKIRLRECAQGRAGAIYRTGPIKDCMSGWREGAQVAVQLLEKAEALGEGVVQLCVQRWRPSTYAIEPMQEVEVSGQASLSQLKEILCELDGISIRNLEVAFGFNYYRALEVLELPEHKWEDLGSLKSQRSLFGRQDKKDCVSGPPLHLKDGDLVLIKDSSEDAKILTAEEKKKLEGVKVYRGQQAYGYGRREEGIHINVTSQGKHRRKQSLDVDGGSPLEVAVAISDAEVPGAEAKPPGHDTQI